MKLWKSKQYATEQDRDSNIKKLKEMMKMKKFNKRECPESIENDPHTELKKLWIIRKKLRIRGDSVYILDDGKYRLILPENKRLELIDLTHKNCCHAGYHKTYDLLRRNYYWPEMHMDIRMRLQQCDICQKNKNNKYGSPAQQKIHTSFPFERIAIDITGPLPTSRNGHSYILGIIDYFSKFTMLIPLKKTDSTTIAKCILQNWISIFGAPHFLQSDRGTNLDSELMKEFSHLFGIAKIRSTPYHSKSNGTVERIFRSIKEKIRCAVKETQSDWPDVIPLVEMSMRGSVHSTTGVTPYETLFGKQMRSPFYEELEINKTQHEHKTMNIYVATLRKQVEDLRQKIKTKMIDQHTEDVKRNVCQPFKIGDQVWVKTLKVKRDNFLSDRFEGPYTIEKELGKYSFRLKKYNGKEIIDRHQDFLKRCIQKETVSRTTSVASKSIKSKPEEANNKDTKKKTPKIEHTMIRTKRDTKKPERYGFRNINMQVQHS